jgi:hypothetical protein
MLGLDEKLDPQRLREFWIKCGKRPAEFTETGALTLVDDKLAHLSNGEDEETIQLLCDLFGVSTLFDDEGNDNDDDEGEE